MFNKNWILPPVSLALLFLVVELFFRLFFPHSGFSLTYAPWGWTHSPDTEVTFYTELPQFNLDLRKRPYPIPIKYNSKGLRELDYEYEKGNKVFRILVLGDSWAEDMGSFFLNLHTKWLERKLNKLGYDYKFEVINGGHYAMENSQELMFYLKEGQKYSPDIVLLMYAGDYAAHASLDNKGKLVLHYKKYTFQQKLYRNLVSLIRRNTQFGSFLIDRSSRIKKYNSFLTKRGYKEKDVPVVGPKEIKALDQKKDKKYEGFADVDKAIWQTFKDEIGNNNGIFIFMHCWQFDEPKDLQFFIDNNISVFEIGKTLDPDLRGMLKENDKKNGTYDKFYDSHRFGYKYNEKVADLILSFLLKNKLLPINL